MIRIFLAGIALLTFSTSAFSAHIINGALDNSDASWNGCGSTAVTGCFYDVFLVNVDMDGLYTFTSEYAGDAPTDQNLDGYLRLYSGGFDANNPGTNQIAFDDDYTDSGGFPSCLGQNCSQIADVKLTAGTYFMVVTSFTNVGTSFGQPTGPWQVTGTGAGNVDLQAVPIPAALWLMGSALFGLVSMRRRRN